jgi:hypothetical protein
MFHLRCHSLIASKCDKAGNERDVGKSFAGLAICAESSFIAIGACMKVFVRPDIATAGV